MDQQPILNEHNKQEYPPMHMWGMEIPLILLLLPILMMVVSCEQNNDRYIRQSYYIDNNSYVYLCPILNTGDKAEIVVKIGNKEGKCEISWGESPYYFSEIPPYIYDVYEDTIVVMYEMTHTPWTNDTMEVGFIEQLDVKGCGKYFVKGVYRKFYNGWSSRGRVDGMFQEEYVFDSIVNIKDSFYFYKEGGILYKANQRDVEWDLWNEFWKVSYIDSFIDDGNIYKMRTDIKFVEEQKKDN